MKFIVAVDEKWGIGKNGDLLLSIPDDMKFFRETTREAVLVMGYNTLLSFPNSKPLFGRLNIVLADIEGLKIPGAVVCSSMEQLFGLLKTFHSDDVYVVGGGSIYRQLMPFCDTAYITKMSFDGDADTFIPSLDELRNWQVADEGEAKEYEGTAYRFVKYKNTSADAIEFGGYSSNMSQYFKKKAEFTLPYPEDEKYSAELKALTKAYFKPICEGLSAADVDGFLQSNEQSFEKYLTEKALLTTPDTIKKLSAKYPSPTSITVNKENFAEFR